MAAGIALLWSGAALISLALMLYGAGVGIYSIARGTLPLALFGSEGYAVVMGRLARPALIVGAASPTLGAVLLERTNAELTLAVLAALAVLNIAIAAALFVVTRDTRLSGATAELATDSTAREP